MSNGAVTKGALAAFTLVEQNGAPTLQPQWVSRDLTSPVTPAVVNGVVFALASGEAGGRRARAHSVRRPRCCMRSTAATGKELWTSGTTITSFVRGVGPSAGDSQVYVVTARRHALHVWHAGGALNGAPLRQRSRTDSNEVQ